MAYQPENPPEVAFLPEYIYREFLRISAEFDQIAEGRFLPIKYAEPSRPREGMLGVADGVEWNPGAGKGLYEYKSGSWSKL